MSLNVNTKRISGMNNLNQIVAKKIILRGDVKFHITYKMGRQNLDEEKTVSRKSKFSPCNNTPSVLNI